MTERNRAWFVVWGTDPAGLTSLPGESELIPEQHDQQPE